MRISLLQRLIRFDQAIFGLPYVFIGALLGAIDRKGWPTPFQILLFSSGFLVARGAGMIFNHVIDRRIDEKNPRTQKRPLPLRELSPAKAMVLASCLLLAFLAVTFLYNSWLFLLTLPVTLLILLYSYTKRFSPFCHFFLGSIHFFAPLLAYAAIDEKISGSAIALGFVSFFAISGSDILYALQDIDFDRRESLYSFPAVYGETAAKEVGRFCQLLSIFSLIFFAVIAPMTPLFFFAPLVVLAIFVTSVRNSSERSLSFNAWMSLTTFFFFLLDRVWVAIS